MTVGSVQPKALRMKNNQSGRAIPASRLQRLSRFGGLAAGIAGNVAVGGLRELANGKRPRMSDLILTPANARRLTGKLAEMRGAAMKLGQLLSMDSGEFIPPELAEILARLRADAEPMPDAQLGPILAREWGDGWQRKLAAFDAKPIAAASIGQVHRARSLDGRNLAIKIQYPGVAESIESDVDNAHLLLRTTGLLPRQIDIGPLIAEAKVQLCDEADYAREADYQQRYAALLSNDTRFALPDVLPELSTQHILTMTFMPSVAVEELINRPQDERDAVALALMDLVLSELFRFGVMQSDPNLANYRYNPDSKQIVLLDFGATRDISPNIADFYRKVLTAGMSGDKQLLQNAFEDFGMIDSAMPASHVAGVFALFDAIIEPLIHKGAFDFGDPRFLQSMRRQGMELAADRGNWRLPPAEAFFVQRKLGGTYQLAAKLRARVDVADLLRKHL
jgi:predicted unusual protein kinase regulating ubiquinone biosynthesis (AarF/ABC1/UbiB family)